ncbi:Rne/Rng family ribonuclease [Myceligenerans cantabricum]
MRPRRRASRGSAAPVVSPEEAAVVTPEAEIAPVTDTAPPAGTAPPAETPPPAETAPAAGGTADTETPAAETPGTADAGPGRRSRRATKPAGAAEKTEPAQQPEPAATAEPVARVEEKPERARRTRSRKPATTESATTEAARTEPATSGASSDSDAGSVPEPAGRKPTTRAKAARRTGAAAPSSDTGKRPGGTGAAETRDERPRTAPRLATTALLFQAPDMATVQRPRPEPEPELTMAGAGLAAPDTQEAPEAPAAGTVETAGEAGGRTASRRSGGPGRKPATATRRADAPAQAQDAAEKQSAAATEGTGSAPQFQAAELSDDDAAAVDEVGVIEEELTAEGVELAELAPQDFEDDDESDEEDDEGRQNRRRRRRGGRGRRGGRSRDSRQDDEHDDEKAQDEPADDASAQDEPGDSEDDDGDAGSRRRRRRRRGSRAERAEAARGRGPSDEVTALKGSTRLEAKRQRRREGRDAGRRRQIVSEAEFLARRESVTRSMVVREQDGRTQIAVLEDGVLVEHYVSQQSQVSMAGNVYLGRVQNVLPSMEAAFVDIGKGRNAVLYAGEVNWDASGIADGQPRRIEEALKSGDTVLVQVTKDPIGHKGARLTSQVTLAGRYLVFVPGGGMTGISRKLPDTERNRLKKILREVVPDGAGVIVRTAAEGASEDELRADVERLQAQWDAITKKAEKSKKSAPVLLQGEPDLAIRVVRDIFNDDFSSLVVEGSRAWDEISTYVDELAPDLRERVTKWTQPGDVFAAHRVDEQLSKGMDRKVWLPSGGSLVIDRTEAMTVVDVNTGKFTGAGGTLEETVTRNNLEAAEEIVRQLRLRDIGGIIVIDFIDMVLESNRDLVLRRLVECLGRDRTKHQVAEVTSLGLVQMTRKRVGQGLVEAFSETCEHCHGRGFVVHDHPIERGPSGGEQSDGGSGSGRKRRKRGGKSGGGAETPSPAKSSGPAAQGATVLPEESSEEREDVKARLATIAAAAQHAHEDEDTKGEADVAPDVGPAGDAGADDAPEAEARPEPKVELSLPEPKSVAGERTQATPSASLDAIVLPDRSAESAGSAEDRGTDATTDEVGQDDDERAPEPPKGAGDQVA